MSEPLPPVILERPPPCPICGRGLIGGPPAGTYLRPEEVSRICDETREIARLMDRGNYREARGRLFSLRNSIRRPEAA